MNIKQLCDDMRRKQFEVIPAIQIKHNIISSNDNKISQAIVIEPADYCKLINGQQIMYCLKRAEPGYYLLREMRLKSEKHGSKLSAAGRVAYENNKGTKESRLVHFAYVDIVGPFKNGLIAKHITSYKPEGPKEHGGPVAIFRVFRTSIRWGDVELSTWRSPAGIIKCGDLINSRETIESAIVILPDDIFGTYKDEILDIIYGNKCKTIET